MRKALFPSSHRPAIDVHRTGRSRPMRQWRTIKVVLVDLIDDFSELKNGVQCLLQHVRGRCRYCVERIHALDHRLYLQHGTKVMTYTKCQRPLAEALTGRVAELRVKKV